MNLKERFGYWKDTAVMIEGEAAKSFTLLFLQMWNVDEEIIGDYNKYLDVDCPSLPDTSGYIIGYGDEPFDDEKSWRTSIFKPYKYCKKIFQEELQVNLQVLQQRQVLQVL